jgi:hypothetical protein
MNKLFRSIGITLGAFIAGLGVAAAQGPNTPSQTPAEFAQGVETGAEATMDSARTSHSVHWVLLIDTSQFQATAPVTTADDEVLEALFQNTIRPQDHLSIIPFQIEPAAPTLWDAPTGSYSDARARLPETTVQDGHQGGRDINAAVLNALKRLDSEGKAAKAVLVVLTASRSSDVPSDEPTYTLVSEKDPGLKTLMDKFHEALSVSYVPVTTQQAGGDKVIPLYPRLYIPNPLKDAGLVTSSKASLTVSVTTSSTLKGHSSLGWLWWLVAIVLCCLLLAALFGNQGRLSKKAPAASPLLVIGHEANRDQANRSFPASGRIEIFGPDLAVGEPEWEGSNETAAKIGIEHRDLPPAHAGALAILQLSPKKAAVAHPLLYTLEPDIIPFNQEMSVRMHPIEGVDAFPITVLMTIRHL